MTWVGVSIGRTDTDGADSTPPLRRPPLISLAFDRVTFLVLFILSSLPISAEASAWLLKPGQVRGRVVYFQEVATEKFSSGVDCFECESGDVIDLSPFAARSSFRSFSLELAVGLPHGFEAEISVPFVRSELNDDQDEFFERRENSGVSDLWFSARKSVPNLPITTALLVTAKAPTGDFQFVDGTVPAGEGQWDVGFGVETGGSAPGLSYWLLETEYRVRFERETTGQRPGNEWHIFSGAGVNLYRNRNVEFGLSGYLSWLTGADFTEDGRDIPSSRRSRLVPWASLTVDSPIRLDLRMDIGYGRPVVGRNLPLGNQIFVALTRVVG